MDGRPFDISTALLKIMRCWRRTRLIGLRWIGDSWIRYGQINSMVGHRNTGKTNPSGDLGRRPTGNRWWRVLLIVPMRLKQRLGSARSAASVGPGCWCSWLTRQRGYRYHWQNGWLLLPAFNW